MTISSAAAIVEITLVEALHDTVSILAAGYARCGQILFRMRRPNKLAMGGSPQVISTQTITQELAHVPDKLSGVSTLECFYNDELGQHIQLYLGTTPAILSWRI